MALLISFTDESDVSHTDAYGIIDEHRFHPRDEYAVIVLKIFKGRGASNNKKRHLARYTLFIDTEDYQGNFALSDFNPLGKNPLRVIYKFVATIDSEEVGSKFPHVLDFKNDAKASLTTAQRDNIFSSPQEGDKVYNETTSTHQTYTSSAWVND